MADYNIYIHSAESTSTSPFKPWSSGDNSKTKPWFSDENTSSNAVRTLSKVSGVMMNPDGLISQGVGMLAKAIPWVAIAMVAWKITDTVVSTAINYNALETGDYSATINWQNFKTQASWIFKPFSSLYNRMQIENSMRIENYKQEMKRNLLGDSVINSYTNRGI